MKRLSLICIITMTLVVLVGCGAKSPSQVVKSYFDAMQKGEQTQAISYLVDAIETQVGEQEPTADKELSAALLIYLSKLEATILSETVTDTTARVAVEVSGLNLSEIIIEIFFESLGDALNGSKLTDEYLNTKIIEKVNNGDIQTREGVIFLDKIENEWRIQPEEADFIALILGSIENK